MSGKESIDPGTFGLEQDLPLPVTEIVPQKELKAEPHANLIAKYQLFAQTLHPNLDVIYHPSSANDCSPSVAFPSSRVVYADIDENSVKALADAGLEAHNTSALEFDPGPVDVLIMLNPQIDPTIPATYIKEGGYAVVNDYHGTASTLRQQADYELKGLIRFSREDGLIFDIEYPEDYWKEVDTEEEFRNAPFSWGAANYEMAKHVVKALTGKEENILYEYKKAREEAREEYRQDIKKHPEMAQLLGDPDSMEEFIVNHDGEQLLIASLPKKKGTVDDLFVFEKSDKQIPSQE
jgi:hypothetical protein